jgi:hypothetical protein
MRSDGPYGTHAGTTRRVDWKARHITIRLDTRPDHLYTELVVAGDHGQVRQAKNASAAREVLQRFSRSSLIALRRWRL